MTTYETLKTRYDNIDKSILEARLSKFESKVINNTIDEDDEIERNNINFYLAQSEENLFSKLNMNEIQY